MVRLLWLLAIAGLTSAKKAHLPNTNLLLPVPHAGEILSKHIHHDKGSHERKVLPRQLGAIVNITTTAECDLYNGFFYVTPRDYTWQLQCTTNYDGTTLEVLASVANYSACINACADYNRNTQPGACIAVTFNGPNDAAQGQCTLFSSITGMPSLADEEGNVEDSALLILGPDGTIYATPQPDPGFPGAPTEPPTIVVAPTSSGMSVTTGPAISVPTSSTSTTTVFTTSVLYITSCPVGVPSCPALTQQSSTTGSAVTGIIPPPISPILGSTTSSSLSSTISLSDGGVRPPPSSTPFSVPSSAQTTSFPPSTGNDQTTFTTVVPFTEYIVDAIDICPSTPGTCTEEFLTSTLVAYRTELSCTPGACIGAMIATGSMADFAAATCIVD